MAFDTIDLAVNSVMIRKADTPGRHHQLKQCHSSINGDGGKHKISRNRDHVFRPYYATAIFVSALWFSRFPTTGSQTVFMVNKGIWVTPGPSGYLAWCQPEVYMSVHRYNQHLAISDKWLSWLWRPMAIKCAKHMITNRIFPTKLI